MEYLKTIQTTATEYCRYDACFIIPEDFEVNELEESLFPAGEYAVFTVQHTAEDMQKLWAEIVAALYSRGFQLENRPAFERYTSEMLMNHQCEVCLPVKPL